MRRDNWHNFCDTMLAHGLGVEDIAIRLKKPVDQVREYVRFLRAQGMLQGVLRGQG